MMYVSTRGHAPAIGLGAALVAGLAPDGGLYVPASLPRFDVADFDGCDMLPDVAARLLRPFFAGDALAGELDAICTEALDLPSPLRAIAPDTWLLELFHGPTAAFKDFAARFLAACLARLR
ncbi:MAG: threonine synthase, partial [Dokdonella sp.]